MKFLAGQYLPWLWSLALLPPLFALFLWRSARSLKALLGRTGYRRVQRHWLRTQLLSYGSFSLAVLLLFLAAADPLGGSVPYPDGQGDGINIALVVDVSRSMTAEDIEPTRLQRSGQLAQLLLQSLPNSMFTIIAFKGSAEILVPPTHDRTRLRQAVTQLSPRLLQSAGTRLDAGLQQARTTLEVLDNPRSAIILLSDGGDDAEAYTQANTVLHGWEGQFYAIGVGSEQGAILHDQEGRVIQDRLGRQVISKLDKKSLQRLARDNKGYYYSIDQANLHDILRAHIAPLGWNNDGNSYGLQHRYRPFLIAALIALLVAWIAKRTPLRGGVR